MSPWVVLLTWMRRARPHRSALARALVTSLATYVAGVALFVGAPYLLVQSAATNRVVTAGSLAIVLVIIELLAFARSPLRYAERLDTHELGLAAVTQWRRWLLLTVGRWPYRRWRDAADGDLLERALNDTDELQDIWLRSFIPATATAVGSLIAIFAVSAFPADGVRLAWACAALVAVLVVGTTVVAAFLVPLVTVERRVRRARAARTTSLVDAHSFVAEATLLGWRDVVQERLDNATRLVARAERARDRVARMLQVAALAVPIVGVVFVSWIANVDRPPFGRTDLVVLLVAGALVETMTTQRIAVEAAARVVIATERLDELATPAPSAGRPWPSLATVRARALTVRHQGRPILSGIDLSLSPGSRVALTGPVGSGKSTLLRVLASLDDADDGEVCADDVSVATIDDASIREHVGYVSATPRLTNGVARRVLRAGRDVDVDVAATVGALGLEANNATRWTSLSRGEAMRVALARQLLSRPEVLFLDEPTSGLGPTERSAVLRRLREYTGTLVCATHDPDVIAACTHHLTLREGVLAPPTPM